MRFWLLLALSIISAPAQPLVPFFSDPTYTRDEPTDPPWFVSNNQQPSSLYHSGVYVSQESGTNDLGMYSAWAIQPHGCKVGVVDMTAHGDRAVALVSTVSPDSVVYRHELARRYAGDIASGILDCADQGCRVIVVTDGFSTPDDSLSDACCYASNAVIVCSAPNQDGDLDGALVDYPYNWRLPNVVGATSTDRNGLHYSPSATGTNAIGAPGRNIVAAGTFTSGTSWAAPILAGCLALVMERFPAQTPAAYISDALATAAPPARRIDPTAALLAPPPVMSITPDSVGLRGLPGWQYSIEWCESLGAEWVPVADVVGPEASVPASPGFFRARVK